MDFQKDGKKFSLEFKAEVLRRVKEFKETPPSIEEKDGTTNLNGKDYKTGDYGNLYKIEDLDPLWTACMIYMEMNGDPQRINSFFDLGEREHILVSLKNFQERNGISPMVRRLSLETGFTLKRIYELFPSGPGKGACKMAGIHPPTGCL